MLIFNTYKQTLVPLQITEAHRQSNSMIGLGMAIVGKFESFFDVLKAGSKVEKLQLGGEHAEKALAVNLGYLALLSTEQRNFAGCNTFDLTVK